MVDFVGNEATYRFGNAVLRKGGKQIIVGLFGGMMKRPLIMFPLQARSIEGSFVGTFSEAKEMIALLRERRSQGKPLRVVPHHFQSISTASESLTELKEGKIIGRRVFIHDWPEAKV